jgi:hypothetical protein
MVVYSLAGSKEVIVKARKLVLYCPCAVLSSRPHYISHTARHSHAVTNFLGGSKEWYNHHKTNANLMFNGKSNFLSVYSVPLDILDIGVLLGK